MTEEKVSAKFSVAAENQTAAVAHLVKRGFPPARAEVGEDGFVVLTFTNISNARMDDLAHALPLHLSARIGVVTGNHPPFGT